MPKSAIFAYRFCGLGGVETSILNKLSALRALGIDAHAVFTQLYGTGGRHILKNPSVTVASGDDFVRTLNRGYDAVFGVDFPEFVALVEDNRVPGKLVLETHASYRPMLETFYAGFSHPRVSSIVVPSHFNVRMIREVTGTTKPIEVIPNGIDGQRFRNLDLGTAARTCDLPADIPVVLWIGRLEDPKNPFEFVELAQHVLASGRAMRFVVIGDAPGNESYIAALTDRVAEVHRPFITFRRQVDYKAMPAYYSVAARSGGCLVSTSRHESLPMTFIEAMACECPVVSTDVGGVRELIEPEVTGLLYQIGNIAQAARAIEQCGTAAGSMRARIVARAAEQARERHSLSAVGKRYADLLDRICG